VSLACLTRAQLAAENLFLRKQLALFMERSSLGEQDPEASVARAQLWALTERVKAGSC
jgi:hypothetical protein